MIIRKANSTFMKVGHSYSHDKSLAIGQDNIFFLWRPFVRCDFLHIPRVKLAANADDTVLFTCYNKLYFVKTITCWAT